MHPDQWYTEYHNVDKALTRARLELNVVRNELFWARATFIPLFFLGLFVGIGITRWFQ